MPVKHLAFHDVDRAAWLESQRRWLELSSESGGLRNAWASEARGVARAVFDWDTEDALRRFMEQTHERALADAGVIGRSAVLYLETLTDWGPRADAGYVGESIAWVKEGGDEPWLQSQQVWSEAMRACEGFIGGSIARGRRTYVVTSFWRDGGCHQHFVDDVVPDLRGRTSGDAHIARLVRFQGELVRELCR